MAWMDEPSAVLQRTTARLTSAYTQVHVWEQLGVPEHESGRQQGRGMPADALHRHGPSIDR